MPIAEQGSPDVPESLVVSGTTNGASCYSFQAVLRDKYSSYHLLRSFPLSLSPKASDSFYATRFIQNEGVLRRPALLHIRNLPASLTIDVLAAEVISIAQDLLLTIQLGDVSKSGKRSAELLLDGRGAERVVQRSEDGQLQIPNDPRKICSDDPAKAWIGKGRNSRGLYYFLASRMTMAITDAPLSIKAVAEYTPSQPLFFGFDFHRRSIVVLFRRLHHGTCITVTFRVELPFASIVPKGVWFWSDPQEDEADDLRVTLRFWRPPTVKYWLHAIPLKGVSHEMGVKSLITHYAATDGVDFAPNGSEWFPTQNADVLVFRFLNRKQMILNRDLLAKLRTADLMESGLAYAPPTRPWTIDEPLKPLPANGCPTKNVDGWRALPPDVRWRLALLLTHGVISPYALDLGILEALMRHLRRTQMATICAALELMFERSWVGERENYAKRLHDSAVLQTYRDAVTEAHRTRSRIKTFEDARENTVIIPTVVVTPGRVQCYGPFEEVSNRVLRRFRADAMRGCFLRVRFANHDHSTISLRESHHAGYVHDILRNGIQLFGTQYHFLMYSASQLRQGSCWFLAQEASVGPEEVRKWMGSRYNDIRSPGKYAARLGLSLSTTREASDIVHDSDCELVEDILTPDGKYNFTDGCGALSQEFARDIAIRADLKRGEKFFVPSAFQIRFRGCKGMVVTDPGLDKKLQIRQSMRKLATPSTPLELCDYSVFRRATLNREIIQLLNARGVSDEVFLSLQRRYIEQALLVEEDKNQAHLFLTHYSTSKWMRDTATGLRTGFELSEPFIRRALQDLLMALLVKVVKKAMMPLDEGAYLFGVCDPFGILKENEVVVQVNPPPFTRRTAITGPVAVTRNPCHYPGDVRRLIAVPSPPQLAHLEDVIVFSTKGSRPPASMMSGGDLDGDTFTVIWDNHLIPPTPCPPLDYPSSKAPDLGRPVEVSDLQEFFVHFAQNSNLGKIAHAHLAQADSKGVASDVCRRLALLASEAVDFPKTGVPAIVDEDMLPEQWPDFMEKAEEDSYESQRVLGKMYRDAKWAAAKLSSECGELKFRDDLTIEGHEVFLEDAERLYQQYARTVKSLIQRFRVPSETMFFTSAIPLEKSFDRAADIDLRRHAVEASDRLKHEYQVIFTAQFKDCGHVPTITHPFPHGMLCKASAWYTVTKNEVLKRGKDGKRSVVMTFPWVVGDVLAALSAHVIQQKRLRSPIVTPRCDLDIKPEDHKLLVRANPAGRGISLRQGLPRFHRPRKRLVPVVEIPRKPDNLRKYMAYRRSRVPKCRSKGSSRAPSRGMPAPGRSDPNQPHSKSGKDRKFCGTIDTEPGDDHDAVSCRDLAFPQHGYKLCTEAVFVDVSGPQKSSTGWKSQPLAECGPDQ